MSDERREDILNEFYRGEIPFSVMSDQIHTEMFSNRQIIIDGDFSVTEYTDVYISLKLRRSSLSITGADLQISAVTDGRITICGKIISFEFNG